MGGVVQHRTERQRGARRRGEISRGTKTRRDYTRNGHSGTSFLVRDWRTKAAFQAVSLLDGYRFRHRISKIVDQQDRFADCFTPEPEPSLSCSLFSLRPQNASVPPLFDDETDETEEKIPAPQQMMVKHEVEQAASYSRPVLLSMLNTPSDELQERHSQRARDLLASWQDVSSRRDKAMACSSISFLLFRSGMFG
jgi:hypothetical protein